MPHSANSPSRSNEFNPNSHHRVRKSCDACQEAKVKCSQKKPSCGRCERQGQPCTYSPQRRIGRPRKRASPASLGISGHSVMGEASGGSGGASPDAEADRDDNEQRDGDISLLGAPTHAYSDTSEPQSHDLFAGCSPDFAAASLLHPDFFYDVSFSTASSAPPTSTAGPDTQSILFGDSLSAPLAAPPAGDCGAKCYTALLLQLLQLHKSLLETAQPGIDTVLLAEREMRTHQRRVFACSACAGDRSSLLVLATVAERIVQTLHLILEKDAQHSAPSRPGSCGSHSYPSSRRASVFSFCASPIDQRAGGCGCYKCPLPLQVGSVKVDDYSKKLFLKSLLQLRLTRLAHVLRELQNASAARLSDCLYFASELLLGQSLQRVEYLRGQIQVWDC